ncbi:MAG: hypothetical protein ACLQIB_30125 [Isosphaeraceae bacterium]
MRHVKCKSCGVDGILLADESRDVPRCLQCGRPFQVESPGKGNSRGGGPPTDDLIATWISQGPVALPPPRSYDFSCRFCGYLGPKPRRDRLGVVVCPACSQVDRPRRRRGRSRAVCPDCGLVFELSGRDRGRTVLCPGCNYFLGCLLPVERARNKPFWSRG